ncbi:HD family phosphohydrolase [Paenibacillus sp. J31TS4]|uniref:HD-GYP domain-containing protein n=1 Tax=Paenibacillus sp. J31TS4 TaxID=2807195 RepID=UPI001B2D9C6F|nr:HD-GYP domain-containing protein [Paenibacillus sp. J31TS4]GIP38680.1 HD family phosphohydrolase [Paenibacillus sp. J31TS4]
MYKHVGYRLNKDIFSQSGVLILSKDSVLNEEQIDKMLDLGILPEERDLMPPARQQPPSKQRVDTRKQMETAIEQVKGIFQNVQMTKKVPVMELRSEIIPAILDTAERPNVIALFNQLAEADDYTFRHNIGVGVIATMIGKWLRLPDTDLSVLSMAAVLHDIGKMTIPQEIINKPGRLTSEEYAIMKKHTVNGYELLKATVGLSHRVALVALQHHEREDGTGYPFGIRGSQMDSFSKIVAVADVFHAMTSRRCYREASPFYEVLLQMQADAYGKLDPAIVHTFLQHMMQGLIGCPVELTDGRLGEIVMIPTSDPTSPLVRTEGAFVDLSQRRELKIARMA